MNLKNLKRIVYGVVIAVVLATCIPQLSGNTLNVDPPIVHKL